MPLRVAATARLGGRGDAAAGPGPGGTETLFQIAPGQLCQQQKQKTIDRQWIHQGAPPTTGTRGGGAGVGAAPGLVPVQGVPGAPSVGLGGPLPFGGCTMAPWMDHSVPGQRETFPARLPGQDLGHCHPFPRARAQEALSAQRESHTSLLPERQGRRRAVDASGHLAREPGKVRPGSVQVMGHEDWLPGSGVKGGPAPQGRATGRSAHLLGRCRFQGPGCCSSCGDSGSRRLP